MNAIQCLFPDNNSSLPEIPSTKTYSRLVGMVFDKNRRSKTNAKKKKTVTRSKDKFDGQLFAADEIECISIGSKKSIKLSCYHDEIPEFQEGSCESCYGCVHAGWQSAAFESEKEKMGLPVCFYRIDGKVFAIVAELVLDHQYDETIADFQSRFEGNNYSLPNLYGSYSFQLKSDLKLVSSDLFTGTSSFFPRVCQGNGHFACFRKNMFVIN